MTAKRWGDLAPATRRAIGVIAAVEVALLAATQYDITRRPAAEINGSKLAWRLVALINLFGPLAYVLFGRRRAS